MCLKYVLIFLVFPGDLLKEECPPLLSFIRSFAPTTSGPSRLRNLRYWRGPSGDLTASWGETTMPDSQKKALKLMVDIRHLEQDSGRSGRQYGQRLHSLALCWPGCRGRHGQEWQYYQLGLPKHVQFPEAGLCHSEKLEQQKEQLQQEQAWLQDLLVEKLVVVNSQINYDIINELAEGVDNSSIYSST